VIAASGPSLADSSFLLRELRHGMNLWALPSAVDYLLAVGLEPDLVVLTDPAYYSVYHTHAARGRELAFALPLSAAPGAWRVSSRLCFFAQPTFYELPLLAALGAAGRAIPPQGTVADTALELALALTPLEGAPVVFAGLDFCYRDVQSHARPNAFEHFLLPGIRREAPLEHRVAAGALEEAPLRLRGFAGRTSLPLQTYAGWFAAGSPAWSPRVRRLLPSPVALPAIPSIAADAFRRICSVRPADPVPRSDERLLLGRAERCRVLSGLIRSWRGLLARPEASGAGEAASAFEIARHLAMRELVQMRRRSRREGAAGAREVWEHLAFDADRFLAGMEELVGRAQDA
jgi:hypothetical protein